MSAHLPRSGSLTAISGQLVSHNRQVAAHVVPPFLPIRAGPDIDVGRKRLSILPALRRALEARHPHCCFPACPNHLYLQAHHVQHWANGGTQYSQYLFTMQTHNRAVHEAGFRIETRSDDPDRFVFFRPGGQMIPLADLHGQAIDADTIATRRGDRMDWDWAMYMLTGAHFARGCTQS